MRYMGIDEAGRGCVLGSLVVAGFVFEGDDTADLTKAGARDSKTLSATRRVEARERLAALGTPDVRTITPVEIDGGNLNHLEEAAIADLIRAHEPDAVWIDALGHPRTLDAVMERLRAALGPLGERIEIVMEPKADKNHAVVAAASIFAKTTRDAMLHDDCAPFGDLGSGYPSDPKTRSWLSDWAETPKPWPAFVRTRWATVENLRPTTGA